MTTAMPDSLLGQLAQVPIETSEVPLAEETCELMLLRTSRLGRPKAGRIAARGAFQITKPDGKPTRLVGARFEFATPFCSNSGRLISGFVVARCPGVSHWVSHFEGWPITCPDSETDVEWTIQWIASSLAYASQCGSCPRCGDDYPLQLESLEPVEFSEGDETFIAYSYSCHRCRFKTVDVLD